MNETIVWYSRSDYRKPWPWKIRRKFAEVKTKTETFVFVEGDPLEFAFRPYYDPHTMVKVRIVRCDGYGITQHRFFYFRVKTFDVCVNHDFLAAGSACKTDEPPICWYGARQVEPVTVDRAVIGKKQIVEDSWCHLPTVQIISKGVKNYLEKEGVTGCEFLECRQANKHPVKDKDIDYYQIIVTEKVNQGPKVGQLLNVSSRCERCGAIKLFLSTELSGYFEPADLRDVDFQTCSTFRTDDDMVYEQGMEHVIVSGRVLKLLVKNKIKGIGKYLTEPNVPYRALDIR